MIARLAGTVVSVGATSVVLDVNGFGMRVLCTPATASGVRLDQSAELHTSLVVREDSMTLYGFSDSDERDCFELVQTASGIGPKIALALVSVMSPGDFRAAVAGGDHKAITRVPGIGPKGAQKLVLELRDKVGMLGDVSTPRSVQPSAVPLWREQVSEGLQGLGWSAKDAEVACDKVAPLVDDGAQVAELMRAALQTLARK